MEGPTPNIVLETHLVPTLEIPARLQDYAVGIFHRISSRKGTKKAIKNGWVWVNGSKGYTGDWIKGGEEITLLEPPQSKKPIVDVTLPVLFQDDYLAIVAKPAGVLVSGNKRFTLENALPFNLKKSLQPDALRRPEPIHRLDYPTTGALLVGKTAKMVIGLNALFEQRQINKTYIAVTQGKMLNAQGEIQKEIDGKPSRSTFRVLQTLVSERFEALNVVQLIPHTGRRHQLRNHLAGLGHPILGDTVYHKDGNILKGKGLYLHAYSLAFNHPETGKIISVSAPMPKKYFKLFPDAPWLAGTGDHKK